jgi:hypothetical protein
MHFESVVDVPIYANWQEATAERKQGLGCIDPVP